MPVTKKITRTGVLPYYRRMGSLKYKQGPRMADGRFGYGGNRGRGSSRSSTALQLFRGIGGTTVFPERYTCWTEVSASGYIAAASSTAAAGNYMSVMVNSGYYPFNTVYSYTNSVTGTFNFHGTLVQGFSISNNFLGYSSIASLYENYKCLKWKLVVTVQPQNNSDVTTMVVLPLGNEQIPSSSAATVNLQVMQSQSRAKSKLCTTNAAGKDNCLIMSEDVATTLGRRSQQWLDTAPSAMGAVPATADQCYAGLYIQQLNGANNTAALVVTVKLYQQFEFSDLLAPVS